MPIETLDLQEIFGVRHADTRVQQALFLGFLGTAVFLARENGDIVSTQGLLWVFAGFLSGNLLLNRFMARWPGPAALVSLGVNTLLVAYSIDASGGPDSVLWPLFLLPIFTAGSTLPSWAVRAAGLQTALLLCFYIEELQDGVPGAVPEIAIKAGFLLISAWLIGEYGQRERAARLALDLEHRRRRDLERELERAHKLEALGALAGEAAHDFRNILHIIMSYAENAGESIKEGANASAELTGIQRTAAKGEALVAGLLAFGRRGSFHPDPIDLSAEVSAMRPMLEGVLGHGVRLEITTEPELPRVRADAERLGQMLLNLAANARDAMAGTGSLRLTTSRTHRGPIETVDPAVPAGEWALLSVSDSGCGMDSGTLKRLFEPFFTTKKGTGTGLGLASVYGLVRRSGGHIAVESAVGKGTTFRLYLPFWTSDEGQDVPIPNFSL